MKSSGLNLRGLKARFSLPRSNRPMFENLKKRFNDHNLLRMSLTHSSWVNESKTTGTQSNERLEFLGDAVIDAVIAEVVYSRCPDCSEGDMTKLRSNIVNGPSLAVAARKLSLGDYLYLGRGEEASGGKEKDSNLADAYEALVGALFLDGGYAAAREFILENLDVGCIDLETVINSNDSKTELQIAVQAKFSVPPFYRIISKEGPDHDPSFVVEVLVDGEVLATGEGTSRNRAEMEAASKALGIL